jgi:penicillin-binding protein 1B
MATKQKKRGKIRRMFKLVKPLLFIGFIAFIVLAGYTYKLSEKIEAQFDKSHKWDIPSRIYSDAAYYYPGMELKNTRLKEKLTRLGYRNTGDKINGPGDYSIKPERIEIYLHDFNYPLEVFKGYPVKISLEEGNITEITRTDSDETLPALKLEPELVSSIFGDQMEDRTLVTLKEAPQHLLESIIVIEDERFFKHQGIDYFAIFRAAFKDILAGKIVQGGSTLTQQLVKNYFLTSKKSFVRKGQEAIIAMILESNHSKSEILEAYINEIYLGQRGSSSVSGVGEAARLYFAKNVDQLTLGESALLAGMIRGPNGYNPFTKKDRAKARRDFVLKRLLEEGLISKNEYKTAVAEKIITPKRRTKTNMAPYFMDFVRMQLANLYPDDILKKEGLRIFTTLDMTHQLIAEKVVKSELKRLETDYANILPKNHEEPLEGALVSIQPQTGYIRAMVGGRGYNITQFNHISQAVRQPGSTFKPFVYLTAFDPKKTTNLYAPSTKIDDTTFSIEAGGEMWSPKNYDKKEHGEVSLRQALTKSYNIATAKLGIDVGLDAVVNTARDCGISSDLQAVPSISLGSFEVTPLEMAAAYTVFPNAGIRAEPISIIHVATKDGEILERKNIEMKRVFDPEPIYLTTSILKDVMDRGTGAGARRFGFTGIAAGKTGTTSNYRDAWFVGFTPNYLALAWVGYDDNARTNMSGGRAALPIWANFMKEAVGNNKQDFAIPNGIILVKVDPATGLLAAPGCPSSSFEPFIEGTEPNELCADHTSRFEKTFQRKAKWPNRKKTWSRRRSRH